MTGSLAAQFSMQCPICGKAFEERHSDAKPFCGSRCQLIDLGRWLGEDYGLSGAPDVDDEPPMDADESNENE